MAKILPSYIADKKKELHFKPKELQEKRKTEKILNNKAAAQQLLEQCGMKFFIRYYNKLTSLPLRDIEVVEDYSAEEKTERLVAAKTIVDKDYTKFAVEYILTNFSNVLNEKDIIAASKIMESLK